MKYLIIFSFISLYALNSFGGNNSLDTASFEVDGICGMCQDRIENAAYIKGVKKATWDKDAQLLTVIYKPKKVSLQEVAQSVADAGHDNELAKSTPENYAKIHQCCRYREQEVH